MELDQLEREMFEAFTAHEYNSETAYFYKREVSFAKAAASLCREREKKSIELAREKMYASGWEYTEQEILNTLNKKP